MIGEDIQKFFKSPSMVTTAIYIVFLIKSILENNSKSVSNKGLVTRM